jgi:hypothetical protein
MDLTTTSPVQGQPSPNSKVSPLFGIPTQELPATSVVSNDGPTTDLDRPQPQKHGAVHNILSTLGDFLLDATGLSGVIKTRRLNEAMQGFDEDPQGTISRVSGIDYGVGSKLRDQYIDNQRLAAAQESTAEARAARIQSAQIVQNDRTRQRAAAMLGTMASWDDAKRSANYGTMRDQVLKYGAANGLDLSAELPSSYDGNALDGFIDSAVPVGTQRAQRLTQDKNEATAQLGKDRIEVTKRGQDISSADRAAGRAVSIRGQDLSHEDRVASRTSADARASSRGSSVKAVGRYVGDDGKYRVMMADGSERTSNATVRPNGNGAKIKPVDGMRRVVNGHTYELRGGKPVRID